MAPKIEKEFDHSVITNYDDKVARTIVRRYDRRTEELAETILRQGTLRKDVEVMTAEASQNLAKPDTSKLGQLTASRLQLDMCPGRIAELERLIAEDEAAMEEEYEARLLPAARKLCHEELERIRREIILELMPILGNELKAKHLSGETPRYIRAAAGIRFFESIHCPLIDRARAALARLDMFNAHGNLETAVNSTPAAK